MQSVARLLSHLFRVSNRRYAFNLICSLPELRTLSPRPSPLYFLLPAQLQFRSLPFFSFIVSKNWPVDSDTSAKGLPII